MSTGIIPECDYEKVISLYKKIKSSYLVQQELGYDRHDVADLLKSYGISLDKNKIKITDLKDVVMRYENGELPKEIGKTYDCSATAVRNFIKKHTKIRLSKNLTKEEQNKVIKLYLSHIPLLEICKECNITDVTIFRTLKARNVKIHQKTYKLSEELQRQVLNRYAEIPGKTSQIAKEFNVSNNSIINVLKKNGVTEYGSAFKASLYSDSVNINYFDKLDSPIKAYILGLFYADGNVSGNTSVISLNEKDKYILEKIKKEIKLKKELVFRGKRKQNHSDNYALEIYSSQFGKTLINLGCLERKSLVVKWPHPHIVPDQYIWHFIRGSFDGDGSVYLMSSNNRKKRIEFSIIGSEDYIQGLHKFFLNLGIKNQVKRRKITTAISIVVSRQINIAKIYELMYKDCGEFYLTRKKDIFDNWNKNYKMARNCLTNI